MYCGDETGAFIGDVGSHCSRFGYGGEDNPKHVVPSYVGCSFGDEKKVISSCYHDRYQDVTTPYRMMESSAAQNNQVDPSAYLQQGDFVQDWDAFESLWQDAFDVLKTRDALKHTTGGDSTQHASMTSSNNNGVTSTTVRTKKLDTKCAHPLLSVTHGNTRVVSSLQDANNKSDDATTLSYSQYQASLHRKQATEMVEILLEKLQAPAAFCAPTPMLSSFCHGRQTSLVVDVGAGGCRVTPVVDGLLLKNAQRRSGRGGDWLSAIQLRVLDNNNVLPRYMLTDAKKQSNSLVFHQWGLKDVMYELRTSPHVSLAPWRVGEMEPLFVNHDETNDDAMETSEQDENSHQLPDGTVIDFNTGVGKDLARIPELMFTDEIPFGVEQYNNILGQSDTFMNVPIHKLIHASLTAVGDAHARKELCGNIILCGAASAGLEQRLSFELKHLLPSTHKCRVIASRNVSERNFAAWIGGSVLTSLGSFQQLWLSKTEYEEYGATLAIQRFP